MSQACSYAGLLSILPPSSTTLGGNGREESSLREEKEKPKERPDALTMVSHFVKRNIRREQAELLCYCAHGTAASHLVYDSDSKNQYLERGLLMT